MKLLRESLVKFLEPLSKPPESLYVASVPGPFGSAVIAGTADGIVCLRMNASLNRFSHELRKVWGTHSIKDEVPLKNTIEGLTAYFHGIPGSIEATVQPLMITPFTLSVHHYLTRIPYGQTQTYGEIAAALEKPYAARAVGGACGRNNVLIIVPCHRVMAASGFGGFGAGLDLKKRLLRHEGIIHNCEL